MYSKFINELKVIDMNNYEEKTIERKEMYNGLIFRIEQHVVELPNKKTSLRDILIHNGAVCVLATIDDHLVLVRQYRKAAEKHLLEIPAGKLDHKGEEPLDAMKRELEEETGYQAQEWIELGSYYSSPGYCGEKIYMYQAKNLSKIENPKPLDEDEFLDIVLMSYDDVQKAIQEGEIADLKTIFAVQLWTNQRLLEGKV